MRHVLFHIVRSRIKALWRFGEDVRVSQILRLQVKRFPIASFPVMSSMPLP